MKSSSAAASSPLHHLPSQARTMPSPQTSRYSVSNGISPVTIIDETTSDVPLSGNLITSTFVPKIEDTCDSGMYTMDGMINRRSPIMPERSSIMHEQTLLSEQSTSIIPEEQRPMLQNPSTFILTEQTRSMLQGPSTSIIPEPPRLLLRNQSASLLPERTSTILSDQTSILPEQISVLPNRLMAIKSNSVLNKATQPSTSSPNKFLPNSFDMSKNFAPNAPWMLNQEPDGTAATLDNWLGQVYKSDNLTPGLSLPHESEVYLKTE